MNWITSRMTDGGLTGLLVSWPGALVCDAGCGPCGHVARYLRDRGIDAFGVDISPACVDIARRRHPGIPFDVMDISHLELPDRSLDGFVSFYSIIHTPKRLIPGLFQEFWRVLKPGGRLLLTVKGGEGEGYIESLLDLPARVWFSNFNEGEIRQYCVEAGFLPVHLETRMPYKFEISVPRIYMEAQKP